MNESDLSRRQFVGAAAAALGAASVNGCSTPMTAGAGRGRTTAEAGVELVVLGSTPPLETGRPADEFGEAVRALRSAGVGLVMVSVVHEPAGPAAMLANLLRLQQQVARSRPEFRLVSERDTVLRLQREGGLGIVARLGGMGMMPGETPEAMLSFIAGLRSIGIQAVQPMYRLKNRNGDGCFERTDQGLTETGRRAVRALNDAGLLIDLTGTGLRSSLEVLERTKRPVVFSHSNAAGVHAHRGNLTDAQIDGCARTGGVIGISASPALVSDSARPTLEQVLAHVDYVADRVGPRHVGLGDLHAPQLRTMLLARGYDVNEAGQILGGNYLRVLGQVWNQPGDDE